MPAKRSGPAGAPPSPASYARWAMRPRSRTGTGLRSAAAMSAGRRPVARMRGAAAAARETATSSDAQLLDLGGRALRVGDTHAFAVTERRSVEGRAELGGEDDRGQIDDAAVRDGEHAVLVADA